MFGNAELAFKKFFKGGAQFSKFKKLEKKLKREQKRLSRKYECLKKQNKTKKGEATRQNIRKQIVKVQKLCQRLLNLREAKTYTIA
ncbi:hypothetical protein AN641_04945 [Candidatus Epulonipiscioides gigas]|nr:hypothetical protein AN641_04945 [Epulopiscium sp. SCG-C07WGA-EpuloA2]